MNSYIIAYTLIMGAGVLISAISQVLLKKEAMKEHNSFIAEYCNVRVIFAYIIFFCATLLSVWAYKVVPLSMGPIIEATSYVYVTIFGVLVFKEKLNTKKILSLLVIVSGIVVFTMWG